MLYLMVQNKGIAPIDCFTTLGVSTSRYSGNDNVIGKFGSGIKHAINTLLRNEHRPVIYCGTQKLEPYTEPMTVDDGIIKQVYNRICFNLSGKGVNKKIPTAFTLEYGVQDWNEISMSMREIISNALDRSQRESETWDLIDIDVVNGDQVRAKNGFTRVFVPLTNEIQRYYSQLSKHFLHFNENYKHLIGNTYAMLPKIQNDTKAQIYHRGVFVREIESSKYISLFDYNFGNELVLDESRNVSDGTVGEIISHAISRAGVTQLVKIFTSLTSQDQVYEILQSDYYEMRNIWFLSNEEKESRKENWQEAWKLVYGENAIACPSNIPAIVDTIKRKGYTPISINSAGWIKTLETYKIPTYEDILDNHELKCRQLSEPTQAVNETLDDVWCFLTKLNFTKEKQKPTIKCFKSLMDGEVIILGEYHDNVVYIEEKISQGKNDLLWKAVLEEVVHHVTGSGDLSRDIQDYLFSLVTELRKKCC